MSVSPATQSSNSFKQALEDEVSGELLARAVTLFPCGHVFNEDTAIKCLARDKLCPFDRGLIEKYVPNYTIRSLVEAHKKNLKEEAQHSAYVDLLIRLLENASVKDNPSLVKILQNQIEEVMSQETQVLTPKQNTNYRWAQKLLVDQKVSQFVFDYLLKFNALEPVEQKNPPAPSPLPAVGISRADSMNPKAICSQTFIGHNDSVLFLQFTPDGKRFVSASDDMSLKLWDLETGRCLQTVTDYYHTVRGMQITPDGRRVFLQTQDFTSSYSILKLWDLETGQSLQTFVDRYLVPNEMIAFSQTTVAEFKGTNEFKFWDLATGKCLQTFREGSRLTPSRIFADGRKVLAMASNEKLIIMDLETGESRSNFPAFNYQDCMVCWKISPDERRVLSGHCDKTLKLWDLETGKCLQTFIGHIGNIKDVQITPDGKRAISGDNHALKLWDLNSGKCLRTFDGHDKQTLNGENDSVICFQMTPDGRRALSGHRDNTIKFWDLETGQFLQRTLDAQVGIRRWQEISSDKIRWLKISSDGKTLLSEGPRHLQISSDGRRALSTSEDYTIKLWDLC